MYFAVLTQDGSFEKPKDQILRLTIHSKLRLVLRSPKLASFIPIVYTTFQMSSKKQCEEEGKFPFKFEGAALTGLFQQDGSFICDVDAVECGYHMIRVLWTQKSLVYEMGEKIQFLVENSDSLVNTSIQTVLPYCMGPFEGWEKCLNEQVNIGYRAFHLCPVQELGPSGSYYAIKDYLKLNPDVFGYATWNDVKNFVEKVKADVYIDIVMNHVSTDCEWIDKNENVVYNEKTAPILKTAILLDECFQEFNREFIAGR